MEKKKILIDVEDTVELSPYIFGHNLEHTRAAVNGGLSAQMLRNRKFCGKPSPYGIAAEWEGVGDRAFFRPGGENPESGEGYTRHHGGKRCRIDGADAFTAAATVKNGAVYVTVVNDSFDRAQEFVISGPGGEAEGVLYTSEDVSPHSFFEENPLAIVADETGFSLSLPPHSVAALTIHLGRIR